VTSVFGALERDGDTNISVWEFIPIEGSLIMGGTTYSNTMTEETSDHQCEEGCAVVASWSTIEGRFFDRWTFSKFNGVLAFSSYWEDQDAYSGNQYKGTTAVLLTRDMDAGQKTTGIAFIKWTAHLSTR
jgi:hypothetical protein